MMSVRAKLAKQYIHWKSRQILRQHKRSLNFPIQARTIKKVFVILPHKMEYVYPASRFVQSLRNAYPMWVIDIFDVDKLSTSDLNVLHMPNARIIEKIRRQHYDLVIDLNSEFDIICAYIAIMSEAPYRLHLQHSDNAYFNIYYQPNGGQNRFQFAPLLQYLQTLFVKA